MLGIILKSLQQCRQALKIRHRLFRYVKQFASGKGLWSYICATEAFNKGMTRDRCQECNYFAHLHPFPNLVRDPKHGSRKVPRRNDLGDPAFCKHRTMLEVANLIAVVGGYTTAREVRLRAKCNNCGVKGNNTYQIVHKGASGIAMDGAGIAMG